MTEFSCSKCGALFSIDPERPATVVACPQCSMPVELPTAVAYSPPQSGPGKGLAIAALVLGLIGLIPLLGVLPALIGMILGIIVLATRRPGKGMAVAGLVTGGFGMMMSVIALLVSILLPSLGRARLLSQKIVCANRLKTVHLAVDYYHSSHGAVPADYSAMIADGTIVRAQLDCPAEPTVGTVDYFYHPPAAWPAALPPSIIACDLRGSHPDGTRGLIWSDGTVETLDEVSFQSALGFPRNAAFAVALRGVEGP